MAQAEGMRKFIASLGLFLMTFSIAACGQSDPIIAPVRLGMPYDEFLKGVDFALRREIRETDIVGEETRAQSRPTQIIFQEESHEPWPLPQGFYALFSLKAGHVSRVVFSLNEKKTAPETVLAIAKDIENAMDTRKGWKREAPRNSIPLAQAQAFAMRHKNSIEEANFAAWSNARGDYFLMEFISAYGELNLRGRFDLNSSAKMLLEERGSDLRNQVFLKGQEVSLSKAFEAALTKYPVEEYLKAYRERFGATP